MTLHVTIEPTDDQKARLDELAAQEHVSLAELLMRGAEQVFQASDSWIASVEEGLSDFESGRVVSHDAVVADIEAILTKAGVPFPG